MFLYMNVIFFIKLCNGIPMSEICYTCKRSCCKLKQNISGHINYAFGIFYTTNETKTSLVKWTTRSRVVSRI